MYGCANAFVIYGWKEEDRDVVIDAKWLRANGIELFASDFVRNTAGNAIYGVRCDLDENGDAQVSKKLKNKVKKVRDKVVAKSKGQTAVELQFHLGLTGDFDWSLHRKYTPESSNALGRVLSDIFSCYRTY